MYALSHMHVFKRRAHFYCEIFQFGKSIFADQFPETLTVSNTVIIVVAYIFI